MSPAPKNLQTYLVNRMMVYVYRELKSHQYIAADELHFLFSKLSNAVIKKNMKVCGIDLEVLVKFSLAHKQHLELHLYSVSLFFGISMQASVSYCHAELLHGHSKCRGIKMASFTGPRKIKMTSHLRMI